jgi:predicted MFS family arabinose efflux permease
MSELIMSARAALITAAVLTASVAVITVNYQGSVTAIVFDSLTLALILAIPAWTVYASAL